MLLNLVTTLVLLLSLRPAFSVEDPDLTWLNQSDLDEARASRYGWSGVLDNPECPGAAMKLSSGEATRIVSHKSFGKTVYPENYRVSLEPRLQRPDNSILHVGLEAYCITFRNNSQ